MNSDSYFPQTFRKRQRGEDADIEFLNNLFNKKFRFTFNNEWKLPDRESWFSAPPWSVKQLETLKNQLNSDKSQLNDFNIEEWSSHTRRRNPAGEVCWKLRCLVDPEFLTQAWTKFYECAYTYNIVPSQAINERKMVSLHLCEAPGAFITSLNHYLKSNHDNINWKWLANTLNPYYEGNSTSNMINDDRFMFHTLENWDFGVDSTGNLMDWDNSQAIIKRAKSLGKVLLVTADGSIDCLQNPDAQEEVTSPLHYCEIVTALQALSPGGTLVFKLFTMFEHCTVNLLYLINHLFRETNIYKPVTSRQGNSEVYAICIDFKGVDCLKQYVSVLKSAYGTQLYQSRTMFPLEAIPESFLKQIEECAKYFSSIQSQVINSNLSAYLGQNNIALHNNMKKMRALVAEEFIRQYNLKHLEEEQEILKGILHNDNKINTNPRYHRGSYTERQMYSRMSLKEKCNNLNSFLHADVLSNFTIFINEPVIWVNLYDGESDLNITFTYGKPLQKVNGSKFIFVPIFKLHQQIMAEVEFKSILSGHLGKNTKSQKDFNFQVNEELRLPEYDNVESYNDHEKRNFKMMLEKLKDLAVGDTLLIENHNTLTHFNVSILYILTRTCFEKIGFTSQGIVLSNLINKDALKHLHLIEAECDRLKSDETKDVLNTLPVQMTNDGDFFYNVVLYNNTFYKNKCINCLEIIQQAL